MALKAKTHIKALVELGLSQHEAQVYHAALALGPTTVLQLARQSGVKRTTIYSVVESLKDSGLINIELRGFKKLYAAVDPQYLSMMLEQRKSVLANILPEFTALYNLKGSESFIKYYQGISAIKSVYEGLLLDVRPKEDYLVISDQQKWISLAPEFLEDFLKRRAKLPINIQMLLVNSESARGTLLRQKELNLRVKILPSGTALTTNLVCIPRKVVIHQLVPPVFAIVIENASIVRLHQEMFRIIWAALV